MCGRVSPEARWVCSVLGGRHDFAAPAPGEPLLTRTAYQVTATLSSTGCSAGHCKLALVHW